MAGYSKDAERQNKALKDLMSGKDYEKDYIQVGYQGKTAENKGGETRESELSKTMQSVRMPWFCPQCKKAMKKKLDNKFWRLMGHCFDCQVDFENKMRMRDYSEYERYAQEKVLNNQMSQLKDLEQSIDDFEKTGGKKEWFNQVGVNTPELESEKWEMGKEQFEKTISDARDFIRDNRKKVEEAQKQLTGVK